MKIRETVEPKKKKLMMIDKLDITIGVDVNFLCACDCVSLRFRGNGSGRWIKIWAFNETIFVIIIIIYYSRKKNKKKNPHEGLLF